MTNTEIAILLLGIVAVVEIYRAMRFENKNKLMKDRWEQARKVATYQRAELVRELREWATEFGRDQTQKTLNVVKVLDVGVQNLKDLHKEDVTGLVIQIAELSKQLGIIAHDAQQIKTRDEGNKNQLDRIEKAVTKKKS